MFAGVSRALQRLAALGLLAGGVAAPTLLIGWPALSRHQQLSDDVAAGLSNLAKMQVALGRERHALDGVALAPAVENIVFAGDGESALQAALQARLVDIAAAQKLQLLSSSQLALRETGGSRSFGVRISFRCEMEALQRLLHGIEAGRPFMFVEVADLRADLAPASAPAGTAPMIEATLDVFGAAAPPAVKTEATP